MLLKLGFYLSNSVFDTPHGNPPEFFQSGIFAFFREGRGGPPMHIKGYPKHTILQGATSQLQPRTMRTPMIPVFPNIRSPHSMVSCVSNETQKKEVKEKSENKVLVCCVFHSANRCFSAIRWSKSYFLAFYHLFQPIGRKKRQSTCFPQDPISVWVSTST